MFHVDDQLHLDLTWSGSAFRPETLLVYQPARDSLLLQVDNHGSLSGPYRFSVLLYIITVTMATHAFETDYPFCGNVRCELHVRAGDTGVQGIGNWARLPDGRIIGRGVYDGIFLCDSCGRAAVVKPVHRRADRAA